MNKIKVFAFVACLLATVVLSVGAAPIEGSLSVGDFAVMIASRINTDDSVAQITPERALEILTSLGIRVKSDSAAPLTEGEAAEILGQFGIKIQAGQSGNLLDEARANALLSIFGDTLVSKTTKPASGRAVKSADSGPKNSVGVALENTIEDCQDLPHDCSGSSNGCVTCHKCCTEIIPTGGGRSDFCAKFCQKKNLASATDPTP